MGGDVFFKDKVLRRGVRVGGGGGKRKDGVWEILGLKCLLDFGVEIFSVEFRG